MKLRNHPSVKWPPTWTRIDGEGDKNITGELGILGSTSPSRVEPTAICYLLMDFQDSTYMGKLRFGDGAVCEQVLELLQQQYGHPVQQIGDLELTEATSGVKESELPSSATLSRWSQDLQERSAQLLKEMIEQETRSTEVMALAREAVARSKRW